MNPFAIAAILIIAIAAGRFSRERTPKVPLRDYRLWMAITATVLTVGIVLALVGVTQNRNALAGQLDCRSNLATPVNDATAKLTASQARSLAIVTAKLLKDPAITDAVTAKLGSTDEAELRHQVDTLLDASTELDKANAARGDPVDTCANSGTNQHDIPTTTTTRP